MVAGGVLADTGEKLESVDYMVVPGDCCVSCATVEELNGVGEQEGLGDAIGNVEISVVGENRTGVEVSMVEEVPHVVIVHLVGDDKRVAK